jgi:signal peptidase I
MDTEIIEEETATGKEKWNIKSFIPYLVIVVAVVLIRIFIMTPVKVDGVSMVPTLKEGEILILNKFSTKFKRFDIVVIKHGNTKIIKRIIGMPGETVEYKDCKLIIDGKEQKDYITDCITDDFALETLYNYIIIPEDTYFVMGDNRRQSSDSRDTRIGLIKKADIEGKASFRLFPFNRIGGIK